MDRIGFYENQRKVVLNVDAMVRVRTDVQFPTFWRGAADR